MSNAGNAITLLNALKTFLTTLEADGVKTGNYEIDLQTRALISTRLDLLCAVVWDNGSRAQQAATSAMRAANNGTGAGLAVAQEYRQLDDFVNAITAQVNAITNPTSIGRRAQNPLL